MADVRLTATNPEDSSVVPVACDASGRLLLEEAQVVEGPPGPEGPRGPKGDDGKDGDPFSGNFADNVTFGGSAEFAGGEAIIGSDGSAQFAGGTHDFYVDGKVTLADSHFVLEPYGLLRVFRDVNPEYPCISWGPSLNDRSRGAFYPDGSATFANNKAGFTSEGYLWCTTRRGDTVVLDFTSNGAGQWIEYTPTTRIDDL